MTQIFADEERKGDEGKGRQVAGARLPEVFPQFTELYGRAGSATPPALRRW